MKRGQLEIIGDFLQKVHEKPNWAPSRILGSLSMEHRRLQSFIDSSFVEIKGEKPKRRLLLTEKGKQFLEHYQLCKALSSEGYL